MREKKRDSRRATDASPGSKKRLHLKHTPGKQTKSRNADDLRESVVREMRRFGLDSGWACMNTKGLGLPWCCALVLLLRSKQRRQRNVKNLARYFVRYPHEIDWRETRYTPESLEGVTVEKWALLMGSRSKRAAA